MQLLFSGLMGRSLPLLAAFVAAFAEWPAIHRLPPLWTLWLQNSRRRPALSALLERIRPALLLGLVLGSLALPAKGGAVMSSLNPPYLLAGGPDATVTLGGSGFVQGSTVLFGSRPLVTTYISSTEMTFVVPASCRSLSGPYQLTLNNPDGSAAAYLYLVIKPVLAGVTPNSAPVGSPTTPVTITGVGFAPGFGLEFITASSTSSIDFSVVNSTTITAFIGAALLAKAGAAKIQVFETNSSANTVPFTITAATQGKATLSSMAPASLAAGGPGITIQVNGSGFAYGCTAQWNGTAISTSVINATQLSVQIPAALTAVPGSGSITVINPGAAASNALTFTVTAQNANVRSLSPTSAVAGGPALTLGVNGFPNSSFSGGAIFPGAVVQWNGTPLATTYVSSYELTAQVPASLIATPGTANVTIVNPGGSPGMAAVFTILAASPPALASLSPTSATVGSVTATWLATHQEPLRRALRARLPVFVLLALLTMGLPWLDMDGWHAWRIRGDFPGPS